MGDGNEVTLRDRVRALTDDALLEMLESGTAEYTAEAAQFAVEELGNRGFDRVDALREEVEAERRFCDSCWRQGTLRWKLPPEDRSWSLTSGSQWWLGKRHDRCPTCGSEKIHRYFSVGVVWVFRTGTFRVLGNRWLNVPGLLRRLVSRAKSRR